ncbi:MAG: hypothetical protein RLZZ301_845 [Bacteroidota bacterium]
MKSPFQTLSFQDFSVELLYNYLQLRSEVFVVEQNCVYQDLDNKDQKALHVVYLEGEQLIACARILPAGIGYEHLSIGRVIVKKSHRHQQIAHQLMQFCHFEIQARFGAQVIVLSAQAHLEKFYEAHQFRTCSAPYLEDGIPHILMTYTPNS